MENHKNQVMDYLTKTSKHTFTKTDLSDPTKFTYFKVFINDSVITVLENNKIRTIDVDWYVRYYKENAKNVITHSLFLNKKMKSVKTTKFVKSQIEDILQNIKK